MTKLILSKNTQMRLLIFAFFLSTNLALHSQVDTKLIWLTPDSTMYCLDSAEFRLGQLDFFTTRDQAKLYYGQPKNTEQNLDLNTEKWTYDDFILDLSGSGVYYIILLNNILNTPSGIQIGQTIGQVFEILGETPDKKYFYYHESDYEIQLANCDYQMYLVLRFNNEDKLTNIELGVDLP